MRKRKYIVISLLVVVIATALILVNKYFNTVVLIQNTSSQIDPIEIHVWCDDNLLIKDFFPYSNLTPDYENFFINIPRGKHNIKIICPKHQVEKTVTFKFSGPCSIIKIEFDYVHLPATKKGNEMLPPITLVDKRLNVLIINDNKLNLQ